MTVSSSVIVMKAGRKDRYTKEKGKERKREECGKTSRFKRKGREREREKEAALDR